MEIILKYFSDFTETQLQQFRQLEPLYKEWNEKINVISRKDIGSLYERHVLHSLSIAAAFELEAGMEVIDIGTGGGFPGIPLAIFFPEVNFYLVDSIAKKLKVVEAVAEGIGLKNISTRHTRAEEIKGRKFDLAVSRAVAPLKELWGWSKPLLKNKHDVSSHRLRPDEREEQDKKGYIGKIQPGLVCLKGGNLANEIQESGTRPRIMEINNLFDQEFFREKYMLYIPK